MELRTPYSLTTHQIQVDVAPLYLPKDSKPEEDLYVYMYGVKFTNKSNQVVQLMRRKWIIRDGLKRERIVEGAGVIGQTPKLLPKTSFQYSSYCTLKTPTGNMRGHYLFRSEERESFSVEIPLFFLRTVDQLDTSDRIYSQNLH